MSRTSGHAHLAVELDRASTAPLRDQLAEQIRALIVRGSLTAGMSLPPSRGLAAHLSVSRGVVVDAYGDLRQQGYLVVRARSLPRVAETVPPVQPAAPPPSPPRVDLVPAGADPTLFPRRTWGRAQRRALQAATDQALGEPDPRGQAALRRALAEHLGRSRGVTTTPDRVLVCQGATQAIEVACRLLAAAGARSIAVEDPCRPATREAVTRAGLTAVPVPVDQAGMAVGRIAAVDAVLVAPAHQFPTGQVLSRERRAALLALGLMVIEDDRGSEHRYDPAPPAALQGSAETLVLHAGSVSQSLAPALRIGWLVVPPSLADAGGALRASLDGGSPVLDQLALADLLDSAAYDRHLRLARAEYGRRRRALVAALAEALPDARVGGDAAGLHVAVELPGPVDRTVLARRAGLERLALLACEDLLREPGRRARTLAIGYARLPAVAAAAAVGALARALAAEPAVSATRARARRVPVAAGGGTPTAGPGQGLGELTVLAFDARGAREADTARIVAAIRGSGANLVGLQNAAGGTERIARALGWPAWNAAHHVVSRFPLLRPAGLLHLLVEVVPGGYLAHANVYLTSDLYGPGQVIAGASPGRVAASERRVRLPEIAPVLGELRSLVAQGAPAILTGGFNAPLGPGWPVADAIAAAGFIDAFGERPGSTWPAGGFPADPADGSDRIDGVIVGGPVEVLAADLVGEPGGQHVTVAVAGWPSDHRAIAARLRVIPALAAPFAAPVHASVPIGMSLAVSLGGGSELGGHVALVSDGGDPGRPARRRPVVDAVDGVLRIATAGLRPGGYELVRRDRGGAELSRSAVWLSAGAAPAISAGRGRYRVGEPLELSWRDAPGNRWDWVGIYQAGADPAREEPLAYRYCAARPSGALTLDEPLAPGSYVASLMLDDGYDVLALTAFEVRARDA